MAYKPRWRHNRTPSNGPQCRIWWNPTIQAYQLTLPHYNQQFIEALKRLIPASDRDFDTETNFWVISERLFSPVKMLAQAIWHKPEQVEIEDRATVEAQERAVPQLVSRASLVGDCNQFLALVGIQFSGTPADNFIKTSFVACQTAYRKAATQLHPDKGGDAVKMAELNDLWARIKKEVR